VLAFLHPVNQPRFHFARKGREVIEGVTTWAVDYVEQGRPAFVVGGSGEDLLGRGTVWIDPVDGKVLRTSFKVHDASGLFQVALETTFGYWSDGLLWVPREMTELSTTDPGGVERTPQRRDLAPGGREALDAAAASAGLTDERVELVARYSDFRRFREPLPPSAPGALAQGVQAVTIHHEPVRCLTKDAVSEVAACFEPRAAVARASLFFRAVGTADWYVAPMHPAGACHAARLPRPTAAAVEYYVDLLSDAAVEARTPRYQARVASACRDGAPTPADTAARAVEVLARPGAPSHPAGFRAEGIVSTAAPEGWIAVDAERPRTSPGAVRRGGRTDDALAALAGAGILGSGAYLKMRNDAENARPPVDKDGDGFAADVDCDDARAEVHPDGGFSFTMDFAFAPNSDTACGAGNAAQQVYHVRNSGCTGLFLSSLSHVVVATGDCPGGSYAESLPLTDIGEARGFPGAGLVPFGADVVIRRGAAPGTARSLCCATPPCRPGACHITDTYTLQTSAGTRTLRNEYQVTDPTGESCPRCETAGAASAAPAPRAQLGTTRRAE